MDFIVSNSVIMVLISCNLLRKNVQKLVMISSLFFYFFFFLNNDFCTVRLNLKDSFLFDFFPSCVGKKLLSVDAENCFNCNRSSLPEIKAWNCNVINSNLENL